MTEATEQRLLQLARNRQYLAIGLLLLLADFVAGLLVMMNRLRDPSARPLPLNHPLFDAGVAFGALLCVATWVILPVGGLWYVAGLLAPSLHARSTRLFPWLALVPWLVATLVMALP